MTGRSPPAATVLARGAGYGVVAGAGLGLLVMGVLAVLSVTGSDPVPEGEVVALALVVATAVGAVSGAAFGLVIAGLSLPAIGRSGPEGARPVAAATAALGAALVTAVALGSERPASELPVYVAAVLAVAAAAAALAWWLAPGLARPVREDHPLR
jgi:hypothetical protein